MENENIIFISGGEYNQVRTALKQWVELYSGDLKNGLSFNLYRYDLNKHIIQADKKLDNEGFFFLVNYMKSPIDIYYKIDVEGYTTGKEDNLLKGKNLLVYICPDDKDYDNVFVVTSENENFKVDFGGKITQSRNNKKFKFPTGLNLESPEVFYVKKQPSDLKKKNDENKLFLRYQIVWAIAISAYFFSFLTMRADEAFILLNSFIPFAIYFWLYNDYKILRNNLLFNVSVLFAFAILLYGFFLMNRFQALDYSPLIFAASSMPLCLLIVQRPLRLIFIKKVKREPTVDKYPAPFEDIAYSIVLFFTSLSLTVIFLFKLRWW